MSWMVTRHQLDAAQIRAIDLVLDEGNYYVKGEAGTGKSVVLAHAAMLYKRQHPEAKICALTYTNALVACLNEGLDGKGVDCMTIHKFMKLPKNRKYDLVFIDEVQDLEPDWAQQILVRGKKFVLFGDFAQSIYVRDSGLKKGEEQENELQDIFTVREVIELTKDYRLPKNCRSLVQTIFPDREFQATPWRLMANAQIPLFRADSWEEEMKFVVQKARTHAVAGSPAVILFEEKRAIFHFFHTILEDYTSEGFKLDNVNDLLEKYNVPIRFLGNRIGDFKEGDKKPLTYVMTWHSSKGLDFETVILPNLAKSPCRANPLYVALTRARRNLVLTYSGKQNDQIEKATRCAAVCMLATDKGGRVTVKSKGPEQGLLF